MSINDSERQYSRKQYLYSCDATARSLRGTARAATGEAVVHMSVNVPQLYNYLWWLTCATFDQRCQVLAFARGYFGVWPGPLGRSIASETRGLRRQDQNSVTRTISVKVKRRSRPVDGGNSYPSPRRGGTLLRGTLVVLHCGDGGR